MDKATGQPKGTAFVEFRGADSAAKATSRARCSHHAFLLSQSRLALLYLPYLDELTPRLTLLPQQIGKPLLCHLLQGWGVWSRRGWHHYCRSEGAPQGCFPPHPQIDTAAVSSGLCQLQSSLDS